MNPPPAAGWGAGGQATQRGGAMSVTMPTGVLAREQHFFDQEAADLVDRDLLIPPDQMERYKHARRGARNTPKDALFALMLPVQGKRVLEYGCGHGENAVHLASCGAEVTAFDLSPL